MPSSDLRDLVYELPTVVENFNASLDAIDGAVGKLRKQKNAIGADVQGAMTSASDDWTAWKASDLGSYQVSTWGGYGVSGTGGNLTSWHIYDWTSTPHNPATNPSYVVYESSDVTSAGPAADNGEARQYDRQNEFSKAIEHIEQPFGVATGTYGIDAKIAALSRGRSLQAVNEAKYSEVLKIYDKYNNNPPAGA